MYLEKLADFCRIPCHFQTFQIGPSGHKLTKETCRNGTNIEIIVYNILVVEIQDRCASKNFGAQFFKP